MASWAIPVDWSAGDMAANASASGTYNMNQQVQGNMEWLGTTHHHSGGTDGNSGLGPVSFVDIARGASPASAGAGTLRSWATAAVHSAPNAQYYFFAGATAVVQLIDTSHSHGY
jgi:hypothetical protein